MDTIEIMLSQSLAQFHLELSICDFTESTTDHMFNQLKIQRNIEFTLR